jgi:hypothetical protein
MQWAKQSHVACCRCVTAIVNGLATVCRNVIPVTSGFAREEWSSWIRNDLIPSPSPAAPRAPIHRDTGLPIGVRSRALAIAYNRISRRLESAKRLHRYLNLADDGNHARLDTSIARFVGFLRLSYFTIGSNPPRWSGSRPPSLPRLKSSRIISFASRFDVFTEFVVGVELSGVSIRRNGSSEAS